MASVLTEWHETANCNNCKSCIMFDEKDIPNMHDIESTDYVCLPCPKCGGTIPIKFSEIPSYHRNKIKNTFSWHREQRDIGIIGEPWRV